ncbi:MAG: hypothetical protein OQK09_00945 [Colwellia sp.]|nr:hypothetical protein [Colwellia sp.]MCW9080055.1 hypothetical protein [Colwellia sp.]
MHDLAILAVSWPGAFVANFLAGKTRITPVLWYFFVVLHLLTSNSFLKQRLFLSKTAESLIIRW